MGQKKARNTKGRIVAAAWKLFYDQGYEATTIDDIIAESETSRGSFYHYFNGKDVLLGSLSYLFDEKYMELEPRLAEFETGMEKLLFLNRELFDMIENSIAIELLARLLSTQLTTKGEKHLLDRGRYYYKLLRRIVQEGQQSGELRRDLSVNEQVKLYAIGERALLYDWCICNGEYSLRSYGEAVMPFFLQKLAAGPLGDGTGAKPPT
ncbi:MAG: TetR/AcrR family transcriptional regulator [Oscillospiraceae bacterium]|nr:TetR/AcrR family transcriptional regulator [Oscillospiraceae bacterium]